LTTQYSPENVSTGSWKRERRRHTPICDDGLHFFDRCCLGRTFPYRDVGLPKRSGDVVRHRERDRFRSAELKIDPSDVAELCESTVGRAVAGTKQMKLEAAFTVQECLGPDWRHSSQGDSAPGQGVGPDPTLHIEGKELKPLCDRGVHEWTRDSGGFWISPKIWHRLGSWQLHA
jgi:hypothetical protein